MARITLLTDFGTEDGFVGAMKGVLATHAPMALVEDITHAVPPGDVRKASQVLGRYWCRFPPRTVHLVVIDPGVGTSRRSLAVRADERLLVGPDNGLFSLVFSEALEWVCVELKPSELLPAPTSETFHGRDWFAPAAALLATGTPLELLGEPISDPVLLREVPRKKVGEWVVGEVVEVDRFGNLATNLPEELVRLTGEVGVEGCWIPLRRSYGEVESGELLALIDSDGRVEVAVRDGSATKRLGVGMGGSVRIRIPPEAGAAYPPSSHR
ncbi:MAG: SAM-dependent chlorinase/fluorinase [Gemmatimonadota bacterium]